jgi:hypothetical protein
MPTSLLVENQTETVHGDGHDDSATGRIILMPLDASEGSPKTLNWAVENFINAEKDLVVILSCFRSAQHELAITRGVDFEGLTPLAF